MDVSTLIADAKSADIAVRMAVGIENVAYDGGWGQRLVGYALQLGPLADALSAATRENEELRNRLWAAERRYHTLDEWEREPEDG
jgi:hypothetical protein